MTYPELHQLIALLNSYGLHNAANVVFNIIRLLEHAG